MPRHHFWVRTRHPLTFPVRLDRGIRELALGTPSYSLHGLPANAWVIALVAGWVLFGLIGHDPWKPDEAHYFGVVLDFLQNGDWVVPTLAGEPFVEKPPLFYMVAGAFASLGRGAFALHDAARLATGFFVGIALLFLGLTGRELYGRSYGTAAVLVMIGCIGTIARLHQLITDVALFAGVSMGMYGLALSRRSALSGGVALGMGTACAFLSKGLLGPGWLALTALSLPIFRTWRTRTYAIALAVAIIIAVVPAAIWMAALYLRSPTLFFEWFVNNNLGRFLGFSRLGTRNPTGFYAETLLWYALPALPLAAYAMWETLRKKDATRAALPGLELAATLAAVMGVVLGLASDSRDVYLMPMTLPLALLAGWGVARIPPIGTRVLSTLARWVLGGLALLLWLGWVTLVTGIPTELQTVLLNHQPGFVPDVRWLRLTFAVIATVVAAVAMMRRAREAGVALTQWAVGATLCWALIATLWTPYLNAGKSYRTMIRSIVRELPASGCLASLRLGEPQRALLSYYGGITTVRLESHQDADCPVLLVQGFRDMDALPLSDEWNLVWEGARPGDDKELYRLYRRDIRGDHAVARFPE